MTKLKRTIILGLIIGLILLSGASMIWAADYQVDFVYQNHKLEFNGNLGREDFLNLIIAPYNVMISDLLEEDAKSNDAFLRSFATDNRGFVEGEIKIETPKNGKYHVQAFNGNSSQSFWLFLSNSDEMKPYLSALNEGNADDIADVLKNANLGWDEENIEKNVERMSELLLANRPSSGYTADSFCNSYMIAEMLIDICQIDSIEEVLAQYILYIDENTANSISELSQSGREVFKNLLAKYQPEKNGIQLMAEECLNMAELLIIEDYNLFGDELLDWIEVNGRSKGNYSKISEYDRALVMQEIYRVRKNYTDMEALYQKFLDIATEQYNDSKGSGGKTSSKGSGGGAVALGNSNSQNASQMLDEYTSTGKRTFVDVTGHWAEDVIIDLCQKGIINGYSDKLFCPEQAVTRAEFIKMLIGILQEETVYSDVFDDVQQTDWFAGYIGRAHMLSLIQGDGRSFYPNNFISREDAAVIIMRTLEGVSVLEDNEVVFTDESDISEYAVLAVKALASHGIINGNDGYFFPKATTTRAESAALLSRAMSVIKRSVN